MELLQYVKLIWHKNVKNYLFIILSIIFFYVLIAVLMVYIDNVMMLGPDIYYPNSHYLCVSIRSVFIIAGIIFIFNQYYNVMRLGVDDFADLKRIGATGHNVRKLILVQELSLILITIPIGLFCSLRLTKLALQILNRYSLDINKSSVMYSTNTSYLLAGVTSCFILSLGIYADYKYRNLSDHTDTGNPTSIEAEVNEI